MFDKNLPFLSKKKKKKKILVKTTYMYKLCFFWGGVLSALKMLTIEWQVF